MSETPAESVRDRLEALLLRHRDAWAVLTPEAAAASIADEAAAAGLLRDDEPAAVEWEYGAALGPDKTIIPGSRWRGSRKLAEEGVAHLRGLQANIQPCLKRRRPAAPPGQWEVFTGE